VSGALGSAQRRWGRYGLRTCLHLADREKTIEQRPRTCRYADRSGTGRELNPGVGPALPQDFRPRSTARQHRTTFHHPPPPSSLPGEGRGSVGGRSSLKSDCEDEGATYALNLTEVILE